MEEKNKEIIILVEYVKLSPNREKIIKTLNKEIMKPSDIAKKSKVHINTVSKSLKQLRDKDLVQVLNPEAKRGRLYELTSKGKLVIKKI